MKTLCTDKGEGKHLWGLQIKIIAQFLLTLEQIKYIGVAWTF